MGSKTSVGVFSREVVNEVVTLVEIVKEERKGRDKKGRKGEKKESCK